MHPDKASVSMFDNAVVVSISCVACQTPSISGDAEIIQAWLGRTRCKVHEERAWHVDLRAGRERSETLGSE